MATEKVLKPTSDDSNCEIAATHRSFFLVWCLYSLVFTLYLVDRMKVSKWVQSRVILQLYLHSSHYEDYIV